VALRRRHAVPSRDDEAQRPAVEEWQRPAVHLIGDHASPSAVSHGMLRRNFGVAGAGPRSAASIQKCSADTCTPARLSKAASGTPVQVAVSR
jgi:hypothetical protein